MQQSHASFETAYLDFLGSMWEELEDLLDLYYDGAGAGELSVVRLRLKLREMRTRLVTLLEQVEPLVPQDGSAGRQARHLRAFGAELLRLLELDSADDKFELSCGQTLVRVQHRIDDEAQRLAQTH